MLNIARSGRAYNEDMLFTKLAIKLLDEMEHDHLKFKTKISQDIMGFSISYCT